MPLANRRKSRPPDQTRKPLRHFEFRSVPGCNRSQRNTRNVKFGLHEPLQSALRVARNFAYQKDRQSRCRFQHCHRSTPLQQPDRQRGDRVPELITTLPVRCGEFHSLCQRTMESALAKDAPLISATGARNAIFFMSPPCYTNSRLSCFKTGFVRARIF